ncbi:S41 family peptidase [Mucilaginibacter koreensis]
MKRFFPLLILIILAVFTSCKKDHGNTDGTTTPNGSTLDLIKDSIYLYTKESYYWNDQLPSYDAFKPRGYTGSTEAAALAKEVNVLATTAINPATNKAYEYTASGSAKYSFIDEGGVATSLGGTNGDFGFSVFYNAYNDLRIKYVYPGSPAAIAGLIRGYKVTAVNGSANIAYDPTSSNPNADPNLLAVVNALGQPTIKLTLQRQDGTSFEATVNQGKYSVNPVLKSVIVDGGNGRKIGYVAFNSFTVKSVAQPVLDPVFSNFAANGVTDVVVDLRYNGGGSVETAEYLSNLLAPIAANTKQMYGTYFNSNLSSGNTPVLAHQYFRANDGKLYNYAQINYSLGANLVNFTKAGSLNVNRVFFIVTGSTASASELTINNLRPYMDVKLIGTTTYGKPVGFFGLKINKYNLYVSQFETKNSKGEGGYYSGMTPGTTTYPGALDKDDVTKDWGDPTERLFAHAISYIKTGIYSINNPNVQVLSADRKNTSDAQDVAISEALDPHEFKGMVLKNFKTK